MKKCLKCGIEYTSVSNFCSKCGESLNGGDLSKTNASSAKNEINKKNSIVGIKYFIGIALIVSSFSSSTVLNAIPVFLLGVSFLDAIYKWIYKLKVIKHNPLLKDYPNFIKWYFPILFFTMLCLYFSLSN